jgi:cytoplasmic iron level regulating protein YaaA (DUF328/UPF0246 family)
LLLPPSEGKAEGGDGDPWEPDTGAFGDLADGRREVVDALAAAHGGDERLLGVTGGHLLRAQSSNVSLLGSPTVPAWRRYTGVVWDHLDPATLRAEQRRRVIVVSGLLGLARADDPVPDYRLKMGANLPPLGKLSTWWRDAVSSRLDRVATARTRGRRILVDLLPQEHRAAWRPGPRRRHVTLGLVSPDGSAGAHFAKAAKGELARAILDEGLEAVADWRHDRFMVSILDV